MRTIRAAVMPGPGLPVVVKEFPEPDLEKDSALMEVTLSEVCGTDVYLQQGKLSGVPYPIIPGHVSVGHLAKIRGQLLDVRGGSFREGDRVTLLDVHQTCHSCWYCLVARSATRCPKRKVYGITYGVEDGLAGGWSQCLYIKPGTKCISLEGVGFEHFMAGGCSLPTAIHGIDRAGVAVSETVLVLGSGPVGLSCIILARLQGAGKILCIGAPDNRLRIARDVGADETINFEESTEEQRRQWVLERTSGRGADVTVEATGRPIAVVQAMRWTRDAGRVVVLGQYTDHGEVEFNPHLDLNKKHLDLFACWGSDFSHFFRGATIMADPVASQAWSKIQLDRYGLDGAEDALQAVSQGQAVKALIDPNLGRDPL